MHSTKSWAKFHMFKVGGDLNLETLLVCTALAFMITNRDARVNVFSGHHTFGTPRSHRRHTKASRFNMAD